MRLIQILLCIIIIPFLLISSYQFINRYADWQDIRIAEQKHLDEIEKLKKQRNELKKYIKDLESDEFAQERLVRRYGYIKPGEVVYQIIPKTKIEDKSKTGKSYLGGFILK